MPASASTSRALAACCLVVFLLPPAAWAQVTRIVDDDGLGSAASCDDTAVAFATPGAAIAAAANGDTVLVCPGTYIGRVIFFGKSVALRSVAGPAVTILDGDGRTAVVAFGSGEGPSAVLEGFTVRNAGATDIASGRVAIRTSVSSPVIRRNVITDNDAIGISVFFGSPVIEENIISRNTRPGDAGAAISVQGFTSAVIRRNIITSNSTGSGGGILLRDAGAPLIERNLIAGNVASTGGGGIAIVGSSEATIVGNTIVQNQAVAYGGGISWQVSSGRIVLVNNTISDNDAPTGSALFADGNDASALVFNNNITGATWRDAVYCGVSGDVRPPGFYFNNVFSSPTGSEYLGTCANQTGVNGNISAWPQYADNVAGDYHLLGISPSIDAGSGAPAELPALDVDGHARALDGNGDGTPVVDVGADERHTLGGTADPPAGFAKSGPSHGAGNESTRPTLSWQSSAGATGYEYCYDTLGGATCRGRWLPAWASTTVIPDGLSAGMTYYWQVRAHNAAGTTYADGGIPAWRTFTTEPVTRIIDVYGDLDFEPVKAGWGGIVRTFNIRNRGNSSLTVTGVTAPSGFRISWTGTIPPGGVSTPTVIFDPQSVASYAGILTIQANQTAGDPTIAVSGEGVACSFSLSSSTVVVPSRAGMSTVNVHAPLGCHATATSQAAWIAMAGPAVTFRTTTNSTGAGRTGTIVVGDATASVVLTVTQPAPPATRLWWQHETGGYLSAWTLRNLSVVAGSSLTPPQVANTDWQIVGTGDFNGDAHDDLLWRHRHTGIMTVWLMNGTAFMAAGLLSDNTVSDLRWAIRAIADMDGDGKPDIVWQHEVDGWISVWLMDGLRLKEGRALSPNRVAVEWRIAGAADLNHDGKTDLLWQNDRTGQIIAWQLDGTSLITGRAIWPNTVSDTDWKVRAVTDVDGDDRADFIWQHRTNGWLAVWYMQDFTAVLVAAPNPGQVSGGWQLVGPR